VVQFPPGEGTVLFSASYSVDTRGISPGLNRPERDPNHLLQIAPIILLYICCVMSRDHY
jgi:hypothetical protein